MQEPLAIGPSGGMPMPANMQTIQWMPQIQAYAAVMQKAGFFRDYKIDPKDEKAVAKAEEEAQARLIYVIAIGVDMGLTPAESIQGLYVNKNGKVEATAELLKEKLDSHPHYGYITEGVTDEAAMVTFTYDGKKIEKKGNPVIWTANRADEAGLLGGANAKVYRQFRRNMLFKQCIRDGVKFFCPGLFKGQNFEISIKIEEENSTENIVRGQAKEEVEAECRDAIQAALDSEGLSVLVDAVTIVETGEVIQKPNNDAVILKEAEIYRERGDEEKAQAKEDAVKITASQKTELTLAGTKNGWHPADISAYARQAFGVASGDLTLSQWAVAKAHVSLTPPPPPLDFDRAPATK